MKVKKAQAEALASGLDIKKRILEQEPAVLAVLGYNAKQIRHFLGYEMLFPKTPALLPIPSHPIPQKLNK